MLDALVLGANGCTTCSCIVVRLSLMLRAQLAFLFFLSNCSFVQGKHLSHGKNLHLLHSHASPGSLVLVCLML